MAGVSVAVVAGLAFTPSVEAAPAAALVVGGTSFPSMAADEMAVFTNTFTNNLVNVPYPAQLWPAAGDMRLGASVTEGAANLMSMISSTLETGAEIVVWGISQGALVIGAVQRALLTDPAAPPANSVTFVRVADPATPQTGLLSFVPSFILSEVLNFPDIGRVAPESQYDTVVVINEFDGFADFPDRPNLAAMLNAVVGLWYRHGQTATADLADVPAENITVTTNSLGATTTTYLVPSPVFPLTQLLRDIGIRSDFVDPLEERLRPIVEAGYSRYDNTSTLDADLTGADPATLTAELPAPSAAEQNQLATGIRESLESPRLRTERDRGRAVKAAATTAESKAASAPRRGSADAAAARAQAAPATPRGGDGARPVRHR